MNFTLEHCKDRGLVGKPVKRYVLDLESISTSLSRILPVKKKSSILSFSMMIRLFTLLARVRFKHDDEEKARKVCVVVFGKARSV